jgi:hypothetical protein
MDGELKMVELEAVLYCLNIVETGFHALMMLQYFIIIS